ncbi:MAG: hypothetical protein AB8G23_19645 [Myxococcota bacterium]
MIALTGLVALAGCAKPMHETPAVMVKSAQFEIFSTMSPEETKALALELERFHALIYATTNAPAVSAVVPTRIYAFARKSEYKKYGPPDTAGVFVESMRDNTILLADYSSTIPASEVILHEYVHFVLRNAATRRYPIWYDEGFAEFLSTARSYGEDQIALGAFPRSNLAAFENVKWVPLRRVIAAKSYDDLKGRDAFMLYPESWALVHYLFLDRESTGTPVSEEIAEYLSQTDQGVVPHVAFESAFGETTDSASRNIQRILERRKLRVIAVPVESLDFDETEPSVRSLSQAETAFHLAGLTFRKGDLEKAEQAYRFAIAGDPNNARAHVGLGDSLKYQERFEEGQVAFDRAIELDSENALNQLDYAEFLDERARQTPLGDERTAFFEAARKAFKRSHELDPSTPETLAMHGMSYVAEGEKAAMGYPMVAEALKMMPANVELMGRMAEASLAVGRETEARELLVRLFSVRGKGGPAKNAEKRIEAIKKNWAEERAIARGENPEE